MSEKATNQAEPAVLAHACRANHLSRKHTRVRVLKGALQLSCPAMRPICGRIAQIWRAFNTESLCNLADCPQKCLLREGLSRDPSRTFFSMDWKHLHIPHYLLAVLHAVQNLLCHILV